ncbi:MAG: RcnB family protein [Sphingomonas sp.]
MRSLTIAAIVATMAFGGTAADAQRLGPRGQRPMPMPMPNPMPVPQGQPMPRAGGWQGGQPRTNPQPMPRPNQGGWNGGQWRGGNNGNWQRNGRSRWGSRIGGFWWAGVQAPGGWNGYTRVKRGKRLPSYWVSPNYIISDWQLYGLGAPPAGYYWSRYYNDAVLIDQYGTVYDSTGNVDWDRYQGGYAYDEDNAGAGGYADYPPPPQGGPGYGASYPAPGYGNSSSTTTYTYSTGGGYAGGGYASGPMPRIPYGETYYVSPGSVVTVTMPGAVTTTTTTTTYIEERSYVARRVWRKPVRKWRPRPKPRCTCAPAPIRGS